MPPVCQHDPRKENPSVNPIEQSASYMILYCSICKKTEIYREIRSKQQTPGQDMRRVITPDRRSEESSPQSTPHSKRSAAEESESSSDSDSDDVEAVRSGIDEIYAQLEALKRRQAKKEVVIPVVKAPPAVVNPARRSLSSADIAKSGSTRELRSSSGSNIDLRPKPLLAARPVRRDSSKNSRESPREQRGAEKVKHSSPSLNDLRSRKTSSGPASPLSGNVQVPHIGSLEDSEKVIVMKFDVNTRKWSNSEARLVIANTPFQEGNLRSAFHCIDVTNPNVPKHFVCKMSKDPKEDVKTYFIDVEMQCLSQKIAEEFNKRNPPKKVHFVDAFLIKCVQRQGEPVLAVEPYLHGKYVKHTNNFGFVSKEDRNTPQAFSHFSYCYTQGQTLVCDIQGVDDYYTDPQIHSRDGKGWGHGNLGAKGMLKFFETHHCNAICRYLRLPPNKPKQEDHGTMIPRDVPKGPAMMPPKVQ